MRARYEALAAVGGNGAVKKAIQKKQKKIGQKEKKSRPFARGRGGQETQELGAGKRSHSDREGSNKRRKIDIM
jgi:ribosomal RNA-processing protein 36